MYKIKSKHGARYKYLDIPNVLHAVDGFVYLDQYTNEPHIVVQYKDHYVDYCWNPTHYWMDSREISPEEFQTKPHNVTQSQKEMYFHLAEEWEKKYNELTRMMQNGNSA